VHFFLPAIRDFGDLFLPAHSTSSLLFLERRLLATLSVMTELGEFLSLDFLSPVSLSPHLPCNFFFLFHILVIPPSLSFRPTSPAPPPRAGHDLRSNRIFLGMRKAHPFPFPPPPRRGPRDAVFPRRCDLKNPKSEGACRIRSNPFSLLQR